MALSWATPGPVVGAGLKSAIERLVGLEDRLFGPGPVRSFLYDGPSPGPVIWADVVRFFPCAVVLLWPAVRLVPGSLTDAAREASLNKGESANGAADESETKNEE